MLEGGRGHESSHRFLIILKLRTLEIVFQELGDYFVFGYSLAKLDESGKGEPFRITVASGPGNHKRNRYAQQQKNHRNHLHPDNLGQGRMEKVDAGNHHST